MEESVIKLIREFQSGYKWESYVVANWLSGFAEEQVPF
jgi:hypothetical protein